MATTMYVVCPRCNGDYWADPFRKCSNCLNGRVMKPDSDEDTCSRCGQKYTLGFVQVNPCQNCERPVCGNCAEVDYDMVGDPPHYVNTQWICDSFKGGCQDEAICSDIDAVIEGRRG